MQHTSDKRSKHTNTIHKTCGTPMAQIGVGSVRLPRSTRQHALAGKTETTKGRPIQEKEQIQRQKERQKKGRPERAHQIRINRRERGRKKGQEATKGKQQRQKQAQTKRLRDTLRTQKRRTTGRTTARKSRTQETTLATNYQINKRLEMGPTTMEPRRTQTSGTMVMVRKQHQGVGRVENTNAQVPNNQPHDTPGNGN